MSEERPGLPPQPPEGEPGSSTGSFDYLYTGSHTPPGDWPAGSRQSSESGDDLDVPDFLRDGPEQPNAQEPRASDPGDNGEDWASVYAWSDEPEAGTEPTPAPENRDDDDILGYIHGSREPSPTPLMTPLSGQQAPEPPEQPPEPDGRKRQMLQTALAAARRAREENESERTNAPQPSPAPDEGEQPLGPYPIGGHYRTSPDRPAPAPEPPETPPAPPEEESFSKVNFDDYWKTDQEEPPSRSDLTKIQYAEKYTGRGYGGHVGKIASREAQHGGEATDLYGGDHGIDLLDYAEKYRNAASEGAKQAIINQAKAELTRKHFDIAGQEAQQKIDSILKEDIIWASALKGRSEHAEEEFEQAITDYRQLKELKEEARKKYDEDHGRLYKAAAGTGRVIKNITSAPGTAAARVMSWATSRTSPNTPKRHERVRRVARTAAVLGGVAVVIGLRARGMDVEMPDSLSDFWNNVQDSMPDMPDFGGGEGEAGGEPSPSPSAEETPSPEPSPSASETPGAEETPGGEGQQPGAEEQPEREQPERQQPGGAAPEQEPGAFTSEQHEVTQGMGWSEKLGQLDVSANHQQELLNDIGPELQDRGLAYQDSATGEWRMTFQEGGISDEDLQWIHDQAEQKGFLEGQQTPQAPGAEAEPRPSTVIETNPIGEFTNDINAETGYMEGTPYDAVAEALKDKADVLNIEGIDFNQLQENPRFNSAYHNFVEEVLRHNDLNWEEATNLPQNQTLEIPRDALERFLTEQGLFQMEAPIPADLVEPATTAAEITGSLPGYTEVKPDDTYETIFNRLFENDGAVPDELHNAETQREFLNYLVSDKDEIARLYEGMSGVDSLSASWNSFLSETVYVPQVERGGNWYIHPAFIENAHNLMNDFVNPKVETTA